MPRPGDSQPFRGDKDENHREYIPAVWDPDHAPGDSPKVSGGYEQDKRYSYPAPRGLNRTDQRYDLSVEDLASRRQSRAEAEIADTVVLRMRDDKVVMRAKSGNNYHLPADLQSCDCPDWWRLNASGKADAYCKHQRIAAMAYTEAGGYEDLDWSTDYVADLIGAAVNTIENLCRAAYFVSERINNVWVIENSPTNTDAINVYKERIVYGDAPDLPWLYTDVSKRP